MSIFIIIEIIDTNNKIDHGHFISTKYIQFIWLKKAIDIFHSISNYST